MTKYKAKPMSIDGIKFPSKLEAKYYQQLLLRQQAKEFKYFLRQIPFDLGGGVKYVCDFMIVHDNNTIEFIETKGYRTAAYKLKKKLVESQYPIKIIEVSK